MRTRNLLLFLQLLNQKQLFSHGTADSAIIVANTKYCLSHGRDFHINFCTGIKTGKNV